MKWALALAFVGLAGGQAHSAPAKSKASSTKAAAAKTSEGRAIHGANLHKTKRRLHIVPAPSFQLHPDPDRYRQIQQALADKGYFKGEVNGTWSEDSIDALKRFQADQKLPNDGKISALTLTGLGLGPKHDGSSVTTPAAPPAPGATP